jgi:leucyl/phenylalanyl-tRNA--protein transferase
MRRLDTTSLLNAYKRGVFPMAESHDDPHLFLVDPEIRGILPLEAFHIPKRLARTVRQDRFEVTLNRAFNRVLEGCAAPAPGRENTWINPLITNLYGALHREGHAHSVEIWQQLGMEIVAMNLDQAELFKVWIVELGIEQGKALTQEPRDQMHQRDL